MTSAVLLSPLSKPPHRSNGLRIGIRRVESCATAHLLAQRCWTCEKLFWPLAPP
jgi:hypothetical protein